ncbi:hypothetical protein ABKV19_000153, partial [Rosa sericea]
PKSRFGSDYSSEIDGDPHTMRLRQIFTLRLGLMHCMAIQPIFEVLFITYYWLLPCWGIQDLLVSDRPYILFRNIFQFYGSSTCMIFANSSNNGSSEQPLGILPHQIHGSLGHFSQDTCGPLLRQFCTICCSIEIEDIVIYKKRIRASEELLLSVDMAARRVSSLLSRSLWRSVSRFSTAAVSEELITPPVHMNCQIKQNYILSSAQKSLMLNSSRGAMVTAFSILKSSCRLGPDAEGCGFCF